MFIIRSSFDLIAFFKIKTKKTKTIEKKSKKNKIQNIANIIYICVLAQ